MSKKIDPLASAMADKMRILESRRAALKAEEDRRGRDETNRSLLSDGSVSNISIPGTPAREARLSIVLKSHREGVEFRFDASILKNTGSNQINGGVGLLTPEVAAEVERIFFKLIGEANPLSVPIVEEK